MAAPLYRAAAPASLRIVEFDILTLVYHRASGVTHLLVSPMPEILAALTTPLDANALLAQLTEHYDLGDADSAALTARLEELATVGLVERL